MPLNVNILTQVTVSNHQIMQKNLEQARIHIP